MNLTLHFQGQIFDRHILGMGRLIDLEWKRCELDTQCMAKRSVYILLAHEWAIHSLWSRGWGVLSFSEQIVDYVPVIVSSWNFQELLPLTDVMSMQKAKIKGQGRRGHDPI